MINVFKGAPEWVRYRTVDFDGYEWWFEDRPVPVGVNMSWLCDVGLCQPTGRKLNGKKWRMSLRVRTIR